jgi:putative membrane protein
MRGINFFFSDNVWFPSLRIPSSDKTSARGLSKSVRGVLPELPWADAGQRLELAVCRSREMPLAQHAPVLCGKSLIPELPEGEAFDAAYAESQVKASEEAIEQIQQQAEITEVPELKAFAEETLPKLQNHLQMAKALKAGRPLDQLDG